MSSQITPLFPVSGTDTAKVQGIPVSTVDPINGQVLVYNEATSQYEPDGLGTAAYRDVGQQAGNVLELSAAGEVALGGGVVNGKLKIWNQDEEGYIKLYPSGTDIKIENTNGSSLELQLGNSEAAFNFAGNTVYRAYDFPDASGTIALLSQVGDRYLTSSTTSNTVSNGAKTFTVGTGLAYSPTQDVTIVFDAGHHMHASVTSYNSATGVLVVDVNQHTGSGTYAVWTVNVGGIGAGAIPSGGTTGQVLAKVSANNYDDAWVTPTVAVGGVTGLGTGVATALAVNAGSAGAFVRTTDTATTTTAGVVPGIGGTVLTNAATLRQLYRVINIDMGFATPSNTLSGSSVVAGAASLQNCIDQAAGATAGSTAQRVCNFAGNTGSALAIPGALRFAFRGQYAASTANGIVRVFLGGSQAVASLAAAGFGFELRNTRVWIVAHDGTTLSSVDTAQNFSGTAFLEANLSAGVVTVTSFDWATGTITTLGTLSGGPAVGTAIIANMCIGITNGADAANHRMFSGRSVSIFY